MSDNSHQENKKHTKVNNNVFLVAKIYIYINIRDLYNDLFVSHILCLIYLNQNRPSQLSVYILYGVWTQFGICGLERDKNWYVLTLWFD